MSDELVILVDVDNTLLDNDRIIADLRAHLAAAFGIESADAYWAILEQLRAELGYTDYLGALQRYRGAIDAGGDSAHRLLSMSGFLFDYPFADRLYPHALAVLAHLRGLGRTVILTDGDVVFQPRKVQRSGLWDAVQGQVLVFIHKEQMLDAVQRLYPARRYVMIDDKQRILDAMKAAMGERLTTILPRQGRYALDPANAALYRRPDRTIARIGDLLGCDLATLS